MWRFIQDENSQRADSKTPLKAWKFVMSFYQSKKNFYDHHLSRKYNFVSESNTTM